MFILSIAVAGYLGGLPAGLLAVSHERKGTEVRLRRRVLHGAPSRTPRWR